MISLEIRKQKQPQTFGRGEDFSNLPNLASRLPPALKGKRPGYEVATSQFLEPMGCLQLSVTWYKVSHAGGQALLWDIQNKGKSSMTGESRFVLDVPARCLPSSEVSLRTMWPSAANGPLSFPLEVRKIGMLLYFESDYRKNSKNSI